MSVSIKIGRKEIGPGLPVYVIAEAGSNHDTKLSQALELIDIAADSKADAVKFQMFKAESLYPKDHPVFPLLRSIELPAAWLPKLLERSKKRGLEFLVTPFDQAAVDALQAIGIAAFKWASSETVNLPLLHYAAAKGKPLLISTGMCDLADVHEAVETARRAGNEQIVLLQCSSVYPTPAPLVHLKVMDTLARTFGYPVGYSDHTLDHTATVMAVARGASIIEKHFTLSKKLKGPDHSYALEPKDLKEMVRLIRQAEQCLGSAEKTLLKEEREGGARRETLHAVKDIPKGTAITSDLLEVRRPALGLRPRYLEALRGRKAKALIKKGQPITWESVS